MTMNPQAMSAQETRARVDVSLTSALAVLATTVKDLMDLGDHSRAVTVAQACEVLAPVHTFYRRSR